MSNGFLIYALNNSLINYLEMAIVSTAMIQRNLSEKNVTIITDKGSYNRLGEKYKKIAGNIFDNIIFQEPNWRMDKNNIRTYRDTAYHKEKAEWHNTTRYTAYDLSPYKETILLDADYLTQSTNLDLLWGSEGNFRINRTVDLLSGQDEDKPRLLNPFSIPLYWATVVYFRKSEQAKLAFEVISYTKENYDYYRMLYDFRGGIYRNDNAFSIALHTLSGFLESKDFHSLPFRYLYSSDLDELIQVELGALKFLVADSNSKFTLLNAKGIDVHVINKFSVCRHIDSLLEIYYE